MYNGRVFQGSGAYALFAEDWRLENSSSSRRRHGGLGAEWEVANGKISVLLFASC